MFKRYGIHAMVLAAGCAASASGQDVIISEILASVPGDDVPGEWVEIYNKGASTIDISGWRLADEDGNSPSDPFPAGTMIMPGQAIVIAGANDTDGSPITEADFFASWGSTNVSGDPITLLLLDFNITIGNSATPTNEVLSLIDDSFATVDLANYENGTNDWPPTTEGISIALKPAFLDGASNDLGCAWANSIEGVNGAVRSSEVFINDPVTGEPRLELGESIASPGFVDASAVMVDCNGNGLDDAIDICNGTSSDCNGNGIPDECEPDCNMNGIPDDCDFFGNFEIDCDLDGNLDSCQIDLDPSLDMNMNGRLDSCEQFEGDVIITEIMFDPDSQGDEMEYVEIMNVSGAPVDISGYYLQDIEPVGDGPTDPIPAGTVLADGEIAVLTRSVTGDVAQTAADYAKHWGDNTPSGDPINWIPLENWGARATNGFADTEVLTLVSDAGTVVDIANYINATSNDEPLPGGWPGGDGHGSYFLSGTALDASSNDAGPNWRLSIDGLSGVYRSFNIADDDPDLPTWTSDFGEDYGTPGFVFMGAPEEPTGEVIITEIFASSGSVLPDADINDVDAPAGFDEFVEIYNTTGAPVDISGWYLQDEDGFTTPFPAGTVLDAGEVAIVYGGGDGTADYPTELSDPKFAFYDSWGCGYQVIEVTEWYTSNNEFGLSRLSDSPNFINEILRLVKADGVPSDLVNFDDDAFVWPVDSSGDGLSDNWSIYIGNQNDYNSVDNDDGLNWFDSLAPFDGARVHVITSVFNALGDMFASPGHLEGVQVPDLGDCPAPMDCAADFNGDGTASFPDVGLFLAAFTASDPVADFNGDGSVSFPDVGLFLAAFAAGCP